jgi:hypothetical protein
MCLLFFIGVAEDDGITVTRQPEKPIVEVVKKLSGNLLIP